MTAPVLAGAPGRGAHVIVVGAGGNIGSHLVGQLARLPGMTRVTLIDHDRYEEHNVQNQAIGPSAIGQPKVAVQAAAMRRVNPALHVTAVVARVEHLPLGTMRGDLILSCLDGRRARLFVNEMAWHLGVPWIDAGVLADGLLARLEYFAPGDSAPCMECRFSEADYRAVEQSYPCLGADTPARTNAPAGLGALAASLQALEAARVLGGTRAPGGLDPGEQALIAVPQYTMLRTTHRQNAACRFDHARWEIATRSVPASVATVGDWFEWLADGRGEFTVRIAGAQVARRLNCPGCGGSRDALRLDRSGMTVGRRMRCRACRMTMAPSGFDKVDELSAASLTDLQRRGTLRAMGLRSGDIVALRSAASVNYVELRWEDGHATGA